MIDEQRTLELFGYTSDELRPKSAKPIVRVCDDCGVYGILHKYAYRDLCYPCSMEPHNLAPRKKAPKIRVVCEQCEQIFEVYPSRQNKARFCSIECTQEWVKSAAINHPHWCGGKVKIVCEQCKKTFDVFPYNNDARFCSKECYGEWASLNRVGKNSAHWKGGITSWGNALWYSAPYKSWRAAVFKRDNYTCQMCGDSTGGNLQAHHIRPVRDHKNDLLIFDINNGIALCEDCHAPLRGREYEHVDRFTRTIEMGVL